MNDISTYNIKTFEEIKHISDNGTEFWYARELQLVLNYGKWENFIKVIDKAKTACNESGYNINDHFPEVRKPIIGGKGNIQNVVDFNLSRYACYLIVQNADPRKKVISLGQTYFAIQTRKQEITEEEYKELSEEEKRLYNRKIVKDKNKILYGVAKDAGVKNFGKFTNYGYKGLYDGETASDIRKRKNLNQKDDILDFMGGEELGANIFRITQTEAKLKKDQVCNEDDANITHYNVGKSVRKAIGEIGGTMPEKLPTPHNSIKQIEKNEKLKLENK